MKMLLCVLSLSLLSALSFAQQKNVTIVECSTKIGSKKESFSMKINSEGKVILWSENQLAQTSKRSYFNILSDTEFFENYESISSFKVGNGYSILKAVTMADAISIGVSKDLTRGFYYYQDLGSGNGNLKTDLLACAVKK